MGSPSLHCEVEGGSRRGLKPERNNWCNVKRDLGNGEPSAEKLRQRGKHVRPGSAARRVKNYKNKIIFSS